MNLNFNSVATILSLALTIFAIVQAILYNRRSQFRYEKEKVREKEKIMHDYSVYLAEEIVRIHLENHKAELVRENIKYSLYGRFLRKKYKENERLDTEVDEVIYQAISIIDEQRFIKPEIKQTAINNLSSCMGTKPMAIKKETPKVVGIEQSFALMKLDSGTYVFAGILTLLVFLSLILNLVGVNSEFMNIIVVFPLVFFPFFTILFFKGSGLNGIMVNIVRLYSYVSVGFFLIMLINSSNLKRYKSDPLYEIINASFTYALSLFPLIFVVTFIYKFIKKSQYKKE